MRLIDADALKHSIAGNIPLMPTVRIAIEHRIDDMPTIEGEPVKHGRWEVWQHPGDEVVCNCSVCQTPYSPEELYLGGTEYPNYCPNCGAKMNGVEAI